MEHMMAAGFNARWNRGNARAMPGDETAKVISDTGLAGDCRHGGNSRQWGQILRNGRETRGMWVGDARDTWQGKHHGQRRGRGRWDDGRHHGMKLNFPVD